MAQTIKLRRSSTSGAVPTTSQLSLGELALNTADGKIYMKKSDNSIVEVGGDGALSSSFNLFEYTATSNQTTFSGSDSNSNTLAYDVGSGTVLPKVFVYYNGILLDHTVDYTATNGTSVVFTETCSTGDTIQIGAYVSSISVAADIALIDNQKAIFGTGNDLQIYHNATNSIIKDTGSGFLSLQSNGTEIALYDTANNANMGRFITGGAVNLFYNGNTKFQTTNTGINITGNIVVSGTVDGRRCCY